MIIKAFKPSKDWGPFKASDMADWRAFKDLKKQKREKRISSKLKQFFYVLIGLENRLS